jgi:hypothetical protein
VASVVRRSLVAVTLGTLLMLTLGSAGLAPAGAGISTRSPAPPQLAGAITHNDPGQAALPRPPTPTRSPEPTATPAADPLVLPVATHRGTMLGVDWAGWLPEPQIGSRLFVAGLLTLLFSIGALATLALRRRE